MSLAVVSRDATLVESTRRRVDLRAIVEDLRRRHRHAGRDRLAEWLVEMIDEDRALLRVAAQFVVDKLIAGLEGRERQRHAASAPARREREAATRATVKAVAAKVRAVVFLDLTMPNGVAMRFCTGTQMGAFGV